MDLPPVMVSDVEEGFSEDGDMDLSSVSLGLVDGEFKHSKASHVRASDAFLDFLGSPEYDVNDFTDPTDSCSCSFYDDEDDYLMMDHEEDQLERPISEPRVSFGTVHVREFACTLGDHPMCCDSCPITLDWDYVDSKESYPLDTFECKRFFFRRHSPPRMDLEQRRDRITETSFISSIRLIEMEMQAALVKSQESVLGTKQNCHEDTEKEQEEEEFRDEQRRIPRPCSREIIDWQ